MKLTTKASYGVRALIDLALVYEKKVPVPIKHISLKERISGVFLEQIFSKLKKKGLVKSVRGPKGGYLLAKDPADINVYEVVKALEGNIAPVSCVSKKIAGRECRRAGSCVSKEVWDEVSEQIEKTLTKFSFKALADKARKLEPAR